MVFHCPECDFTADKKSELLKHQRVENHWRCFRCDICDARFTRKANLDRHMEKHRKMSNVHCSECGRCFSRPDNLQRHRLEKHQIGGGGQKIPSDQKADNGYIKRLRKDDNPRDFYAISKMKEQCIPKFRTTASAYKFTFQDTEVTEDVLSTLRKLFSANFEDLTRESKPKDLVRLTVQTPSLDYPIVIPFLPITQLKTDRFMAELERVLQSNEDFAIDETLLFEVTVVDMPDGGTRKRCKHVNTEKFLHDKRCVIQIQNDDDLCCATAIVTAKAKLDGHEKWGSIRNGNKIQKEMARQLHEETGVTSGRCGVAKIKKFQDILPDCQIHVISQEHFNSIIYTGPDTEKNIYLYYHDQHYDVITSMAAFL
ncbi:uncharacterized protein LOC128556395 [Mercenaria mercenaria]|uniref:uncharacterized protein LOC128556395 n=1 Tax=Mercenaria mercenaria TaxID=6596 RepID=UPI00234F89AC|nr:uncharacterized protein LOC128556395 [Mercenaria mercenaria]